VLVGVPLLAIALVVTALRLPNVFGGASPSPPHVIASFPVWNLEAGAEAVASRASSFTAVSPSLYEVAPDGGIVVRPQPDGVSAADGLAALRATDVPVVPIISNTRDGDWDPALIQTILHDRDLLDRHVEAIVDLVLEEDLAGIDIDYEDLAARDRDAFSAFIAQLADALHREDRTLAVEVFAKESDQGYDQRNVAQDYEALGRAADQVRLMAYDWHWQTSGAGPIAPADWVRAVLSYAVTEVPAEKLVLGIPTYGYRWDGGDGRLVSWLQAYGLSRQYEVPVRWDPYAASPWLTYRDEAGVEHVVWFENSQSITAKLELAQSYGVGGTFLWLVGDEDDNAWPVISTYAEGEQVAAEGGR
jgi:spore germination protein YaaH